MGLMSNQSCLCNETHPRKGRGGGNNSELYLFLIKLYHKYNTFLSSKSHSSELSNQGGGVRLRIPRIIDTWSGVKAVLLETMPLKLWGLH